MTDNFQFKTGHCSNADFHVLSKYKEASRNCGPGEPVTDNFQFKTGHCSSAFVRANVGILRFLIMPVIKIKIIEFNFASLFLQK